MKRTGYRVGKEGAEGKDSRQNGRVLRREMADTVGSVKEALGHSPDLIVRTFLMRGEPQVQVAVIYIDGLTDKEKVNDFIMQSLWGAPTETDLTAAKADCIGVFKEILARATTVGGVMVRTDWNDMMHSLLSGDIVILVDGCAEAIIGDLRGGSWRAIAEPTTEVTVRGPKDSFIESIQTNVSLIRRRLKNPNLWVEPMTIGHSSKTDIAIVYVRGVAEDRLVQEVKQRLSAIRIDAIQGSGYIEELIRDQTITPFPTLYSTERPDMAVGQLLEGRVAIVVDGTPFTLSVPTNFSQFLKSTEDYYLRFHFAVFMRIVRYASFFILLLLPSIYIAVTTFHHEMIPTILVINLLAQREGIPFPAFFEALLMEVSFEIMREAGVRMPRAVGQAVSIVGAIVLGSAAVEAGVVTAMMVIVVSLTGIASFATPGVQLNNAVRVIRFPMMILASTFGFYGVMMGMIFLVAHMTSLKSFGVPYLYPFSPFDPRRQEDTIWRSSIRTSRTRPDLSAKQEGLSDASEGKRQDS